MPAAPVPATHCPGPAFHRIARVRIVRKQSLNDVLKPLNDVLKPLNGMLKRLNGVLKPLNGMLKPLNGVPGSPHRILV